VAKYLDFSYLSENYRKYITLLYMVDFAVV